MRNALKLRSITLSEQENASHWTRALHLLFPHDGPLTLKAPNVRQETSLSYGLHTSTTVFACKDREPGVVALAGHR